MDAEPVGHGGDSSHGPTGSASALVPDLLDGGALRPLLPRVELVRDGLRLRGAHQAALDRREELLVSGVDSHQGAEEVGGGLGVEVWSRPPGHPFAGVQVLYEGIGEDMVVVPLGEDGGGHHRQQEGGQERPHLGRSSSDRSEQGLQQNWGKSLGEEGYTPRLPDPYCALVFPPFAVQMPEGE